MMNFRKSHEIAWINGLETYIYKSYETELTGFSGSEGNFEKISLETIFLKASDETYILS